MIPYRIFFAAIATLLILLGKFTDAKFETNSQKAYLVILHAVAGYFWVASIFINPTAWYGRILSVLGAIAAVVYCYFVNFYKNEEVKEVPKEPDYQFMQQSIDVPDEYSKIIGLRGKVLYEISSGYIGLIDGSNETIMFASDEKMGKGDNFVITNIEGGKIFAEKWIIEEP